MYTIQWDVDSLDWKDLSASDITQRVLKRVQPGSIVLFHNAAKHTPEALPAIIEGPLGHLANLNTPLAMLMLGTYLAGTDLKRIFKIPENYLTIFIKLLVLPAATLGVAFLLGIRGDLLVGLAIMSCVPSASNTVMFAAQYGRDTGRAGMAIACTSTLSIITMPIWIALAQSL